MVTYTRHVYLVTYVCFHFICINSLASIRLTDGNTTADGYLEIFFQGEWYAMCQSYGAPNRYNAAVVCRELGYEGTAPTNIRSRDYNIHTYVLWSDLYCSGTENSIFDCRKCCGLFYERYFGCTEIPEYTCQSMYT